MTINNSMDLVKAFDCESCEDLEGKLYEYTDCGMAIWFDSEQSVTITGYVENDSDYCGPSETFTYPFEFEEFEQMVEILNDKACKIWEILNSEEYESMSEDERWELVSDIHMYG